jgi:Putative peptidoglycan binding domain
VPRKAASDDETPRRRRGAAAAAVETGSERGLALRILLHSPKDTFASAIAFVAVSAIIANAVFLQAGPHPAPMFGAAIPPTTLTVTNPLPRPRPAEADAVVSEPKPTDPRPGEPRPGEPKANDPLANLVKQTTSVPIPSPFAPPPSPSIARPPAPVPPVHITGSRRVAAVQRVLTEYGYGQLNATGTIGADTQAAIQKFERERRMPVTGQVSDRLVRELTIVTGHPID